MQRENDLRACLEELERTGDLHRLTREYPQLADHLESVWNTRHLLEGAVPQLADDQLFTLKREFLTSIASRPKRALGMFRLAGLIGLGGVLVAASLGASAAGIGPAPRANEVRESLGVTRGSEVSESVEITHGGEVSEAVHEAQEGTPPGPERGQAVSTAACEAAHDRSTLPDGAQDAPGQEDKDVKDCSGSNDATEESTAGTQADEAAPGHEVQSIEPGRERGLAACTAAMDNTPDGGQAAENAAAQALEQETPGCEQQDTEESTNEAGSESGGRPAELPTPARGRP
jgi:hypothetical protein